MLQWMRNNGKGLMAVFGVMLMLVYILPSAAKYGSHGSDAVRGRMGQLTIYQSDMQRYHGEWDYLNRNAFTLQETGAAEAGLPPERSWEPIGRVLGPAAYEQFRQHADMYPLLVEEARQMGVGVSRDQLEALLQNEVRTPDDTGTKPIKPSESTDPERMEGLRTCLVDFLLVQNAFERAASTIKASEPLDQFLIATQRQGISLNMVEFSAAAYQTKAPAPEQMQKQFELYANIDATAADLRTDPFDFGYRYPNRIKLQYISLPRAAVAGAVLRARNQSDQTRYDWDLAGYRYYQAHQALYPSTQPQNALSLSPQPAASKSTRPFKEVVDEARQGVLHDDADKLELTIRQRIISQLAGDFLTWKNSSAATTQPSAAAPATAVGVAYDSPEYLNRLALMIQKNYAVLPTVVSTGDWQSAATLDSLSGISAATIDDPDMRPMTFTDYAIKDYSDFIPADSPDAANALSLYEPSASMKTDEDDFYVFRVTAAQASHAPASLAEVSDHVRSDLQAQAAYEMAAARAEKYLSAAQAAHSISAPARQADQPLIVAGPLNYDQTDPVIGYATLSPVGLRQFIRNAFDLLAFATPANLHPMGLIPVQIQGRVLVGQVSSIQALWPATVTLPVLQAAAGINIRQELAGKLRAQWFNYGDLMARTHYEEQKAPGQANTPSPNPAPYRPAPL